MPGMNYHIDLYAALIFDLEFRETGRYYVQNSRYKDRIAHHIDNLHLIYLTLIE